MSNLLQRSWRRIWGPPYDWTQGDAFEIGDPDEPTTLEAMIHEAEMRDLPEGTVEGWAESVLQALDRRATTQAVQAFDPSI